MSNATTYHAQSFVDGFRLYFRDTTAEQRQQIDGLISKLVEDCQDATEHAISHMYSSRQFHGRKGAGDSLSYFFWGRLSREMWKVLPRIALHALTELHLKAYAVEQQPGSFEQLCDAIYHVPGTLNTYTYHGGKRGKPTKKGGGRAVRVGSNKSDRQLHAYRRAGELPAVELRAADKVVNRAVNVALEQADDYNVTDTAHVNWIVKKKAIALMMPHFEKELAARGIFLSEYLMLWSRFPRVDESDPNAYNTSHVRPFDDGGAQFTMFLEGVE